MLFDETKADSFTDFVTEKETELRHALTAAFGPERGREAAGRGSGVWLGALGPPPWDVEPSGVFVSGRPGPGASNDSTKDGATPAGGGRS